MDTSVDTYIDKHSNFKKQLTKIREILLTTELQETIKWGMPTYTIDGKNVVGMGSFKAHFGIWFFQGALLKDTDKVLSNAQEGKTQAMRQWRFTDVSKIEGNTILRYINEAIDNQKKGLQIKPVQKKPLHIPKELTDTLNENKILSNSFEKLALTKKREFADYISEAKREATKASRLEKIIPMIMNNIGLHDKYKNC